MTELSRNKTLVVLPNDPLERYAGKGEVKLRYFNPGDFFDSIHVITLADSDGGIEAARVMAGRAEVQLHAIGRPGPLGIGRLLGRTRRVVEQIRPQVIRGYNPLLMGWLAVKLAESSGASSVVSVHADYHLGRNLRIYGLPFLFSSRGLYQLVHSSLGMYRTSLGRADHVICAYDFPTEFVGRWRRNDVSVIYNRVDFSLFQPGERQQAPGVEPLKIISVGRQFAGKNPEPLLRAVAGLDSAQLTLVGDGPLHSRLRQLAHQLGIGNRVEFIPGIEHEKLPGLYRAHDLFAINITHPGVCIPVLEAAASGLPVVINQPLWELEPEVVGALAEVVDGSQAGYRAAFENLRNNPECRLEQGRRLRERIEEIDGERMERKEAELYRQLYERCWAGKSG